MVPAEQGEERGPVARWSRRQVERRLDIQIGRPGRERKRIWWFRALNAALDEKIHRQWAAGRRRLFFQVLSQFIKMFEPKPIPWAWQDDAAV
jgi:hypothetical protein